VRRRLLAGRRIHHSQPLGDLITRSRWFYLSSTAVSCLHCSAALPSPPYTIGLYHCFACPQFGLHKRFFTVRLVCTNQPSFYSSRPPALLTLVQYYCTTIGQYTTSPPTSRLPYPLLLFTCSLIPFLSRRRAFPIQLLCRSFLHIPHPLLLFTCALVLYMYRYIYIYIDIRVCGGGGLTLVLF